jgi:hypothetical protein
MHAASIGDERDDLVALLRATEGAPLYVDERIVRRVIKRHRTVAGMGLAVPHARCYAVPKGDLLELASTDELGCAAASLGARVVLVARPEDASRMTRPELLEKLWRAAFHGRIHALLETELASGALSPARLRDRVHRIGQTEMDEARLVLRQDHALLPPADDATTYVELVATYLELRAFEPDALERTFPALVDHARIERVIEEGLDVDALLAGTRPAGARDLGPRSKPETPESDAPPSSALRVSRVEIEQDAAKARASGNVVRASILAIGAERLSGEPSRDAGQEDLVRLAQRLHAALHGGGPTIEAWVEATSALAARAAARRSTFRTVESRLLYDLLKACVAFEKTAKTADLVTWALSLGKTPIVRSLPASRPVRVLEALVDARAKAPRAHGDRRGREALIALLDAAVHRAEHVLREELGPGVARALDGAGLVATSNADKAARRALVDKILDPVVERGTTGLGGLRDVIARSSIKLEELRFVELFTGDALLKADRGLAEELDGVYRRGEIYLRLLQKLSSLAFGTRVGRFLVRFLIAPIGAAYVLLMALTHLLELIAKLAHHEGVELYNDLSFALTSVAIFGLLHSPILRAIMWRILRAAGSVIAGVFYRFPRFILTRPAVQRVLRSRAMFGLRRWVLRPGVLAIAIFYLPFLSALPVQHRLPIAALLYVVLALALNARWGVLAIEVASDFALKQAHTLGRRILPGLFHLVMSTFRRFVGWVERGLYTVDEWLRFREGESPIVRALKALLGLVWFFIAYLLRFYVNLLVEPQLNPIKHFPVVTVSHKIILPFLKQLIPQVTRALAPLGHRAAHAIATPTVLLLPGFFGFLAWELKENWRLYRATEAPALEPVAFGHHGETMARLLRPGFHSGTLPKLYAKLRRATVDRNESGKDHVALEQIEHAVRKFVEREIIGLLVGSQFHGKDLALSHVGLGSNRVRLELSCPSLAVGKILAIELDEQSGYLLGGVADHSLLDAIEPADRALLERAIEGLYCLCGVDFVRERIAAVVDGARYDVADEGLFVWPEDGAELLYSLESARPPTVIRGVSARKTTIDPKALSPRTVTRASWRAIWSGLPAPQESL